MKEFFAVANKDAELLGSEGQWLKDMPLALKFDSFVEAKQMAKKYNGFVITVKEKHEIHPQ